MRVDIEEEQRGLEPRGFSRSPALERYRFQRRRPFRDRDVAIVAVDLSGSGQLGPEEWECRMSAWAGSALLA